MEPDSAAEVSESDSAIQSWTKPEIIVKVSSNALEATMILHPTSQNTSHPIFEDLMGSLAEKKIVHGINIELLKYLCEKPTYYYVFPIARGNPARVGRDGSVEQLVSANFVPKPLILEDGTADYTDLGFSALIVKKGQELCRISYEEKGADGMDVYGNVLEGRYGSPPRDMAGQNTVYNDDRTSLLAEISGRVYESKGLLSIVEVLSLSGDVDNSTGDLDFPGDVVVSGNIAPGFTVKSGGSVVVKGTVEGATIIAGRDVSVSGGLFGVGKGSVAAGGSVKCKFAQNCVIEAEGDIIADSILFSEVRASGDIELIGQKGALVGGKTITGGSITAKSIGSIGGALTEIYITPTGTRIEKELFRISEEITLLDEQIRKLLQNVTRLAAQKASYDETEYTQKIFSIQKENISLLQKRKVLEEKMQIMQEEQLDASNQFGNKVECKGNMYEKVRVTFGNTCMMLDQVVTRSRMTVEEGKIKISPISNMR